MGGSPGCPHTAKSKRHQQHHTAITTRIWLDSGLWFNHSTQSTSLLLRNFGTKNLFCCWREIFLAQSLWEIAMLVLEYVACFHWLSYNSFRVVFTKNDESSRDAVLCKCKPDPDAFFMLWVVVLKCTCQYMPNLLQARPFHMQNMCTCNTHTYTHTFLPWRRIPGSLLPTPPSLCRMSPGNGSSSCSQQTDRLPSSETWGGKTHQTIIPLYFINDESSGWDKCYTNFNTLIPACSRGTTIDLESILLNYP